MRGGWEPARPSTPFVRRLTHNYGSINLEVWRTRKRTTPLSALRVRNVKNAQSPQRCKVHAWRQLKGGGGERGNLDAAARMNGIFGFTKSCADGIRTSKGRIEREREAPAAADGGDGMGGVRNELGWNAPTLAPPPICYDGDKALRGRMHRIARTRVRETYVCGNAISSRLSCVLEGLC